MFFFVRISFAKIASFKFKEMNDFFVEILLQSKCASISLSHDTRVLIH